MKRGTAAAKRPVLDDVYPSRIERNPEWIERREPVVHGSEAGPLDADQVELFSEGGYLFLDSLLDAETIGQLLRETGRLRNSEDVRQSELAITEPKSGEIRSIFGIHTLSDSFLNLACNPQLLGIAQQLLGSDVYLHQSRLNLKPGFEGKEFYWHSDFETWHAEDGMPAMRAVSFSIALTDNNPLNGPLMVIPGSHRHFVQCIGHTPNNHHRLSLKRQEYGVPDRESIRRLAARHGIVAPTGPAGSVLLFDCNVLHGSNSNITPFPRTNVFLVYNSMSNTLVEPFAAKKARPWFLGERQPKVLQMANDESIEAVQ